MKCLPLLVIGLVLALTVPSCSGSGQKEKPRPAGDVGGADSAQSADAPPFHLLCGEGGGFTGQWSGMILEANGQVATWKGRDPDSAPKIPVGAATAEERNRLFSLLHGAGFFSREMDEKGNLTRFVRVEAAAETAMWNWSLIPGPDSTGRSIVWNACQELLIRIKAREE